jgi:hypothetical protein
MAFEASMGRGGRTVGHNRRIRFVLSNTYPDGVGHGRRHRSNRDFQPFPNFLVPFLETI